MTSLVSLTNTTTWVLPPRVQDPSRIKVRDTRVVSDRLHVLTDEGPNLTRYPSLNDV